MDISKWLSSMTSFGTTHANNIISVSKNPMRVPDHALALTYYDAERVFYQIGDFTKNILFYEAAEAAHSLYAFDYVIKNNGKVPGFWKFSHGPAIRWTREKAPSARDAINLLATNGSYSPDITPYEYICNSSRAREVAYTISTLVLQEKLGFSAHRPYLETLVSCAMNHVGQWTQKKPGDVFPAFMGGLLCEALIEYERFFKKSDYILYAVESVADFIWNNHLVKRPYCFRYANMKVEDYNTDPAIDLSMLILPIYGWLFHKTGDEYHKWRGDKIFAGALDGDPAIGMPGAYLSGAKQFNQNYRWSFDYLYWTGIIKQAPLV